MIPQLKPCLLCDRDWPVAELQSDACPECLSQSGEALQASTIRLRELTYDLIVLKQMWLGQAERVRLLTQLTRGVTNGT